MLVAIGAAMPAAKLIAAADRVLPLIEKDAKRIYAFGLEEEDLTTLQKRIRELKGMWKDKRLQKSDTPLQMEEVTVTLAHIRAWLRTLREIASINLCADTPALYRISSAEPELAEVYPRDVLEELKTKLKAATDLKPRLEEAGLDAAFLGRGRKLAAQLNTALGKKDIEADNLAILVRRFYIRKAQNYLLLKRFVRAARVAFMLLPKRRRMYHLDEVEPRVIEASPKAVKPA